MAAPTHPAPRPSHRRARARSRARTRARLLVAVAALVVLAACAFESLADLDGELEDAGLREVSTTVSAANTSVVEISASPGPGQTKEEATDEVAEVVWTTFPHRFDRLRVSIDGEDASWTYANLERDRGERPASLDEGGDIGDELNRTTLIAGLSILATGVVAIAVIAVVLLLVLRTSRRRARERPAPHPWMPPGGWAPAPPPGGWAAASAPPGPPGSSGAAPDGPSAPTAPTPPAPAVAPVSLAKDQTDTGPVPPPPPPPPEPRGRRPRDPDARRLGRRPRGPQPTADHTPPGWG